MLSSVRERTRIHKDLAGNLCVSRLELCFQVISVHLISRTLDNDDPSFRVPFGMVDVAPKEVVLDIEVLGSCGDPLIGCKQIRALVVLIKEAMHFNRLSAW